MIDILREVGMIERALDSMSNIEFKQIGLARGQYLYVVRIYEHPGIISEAMGHSSIAITEIYLKPFQNEKIDLAKNYLLCKDANNRGQWKHYYIENIDAAPSLYADRVDYAYSNDSDDDFWV